MSHTISIFVGYPRLCTLLVNCCWWLRFIGRFLLLKSSTVHTIGILCGLVVHYVGWLKIINGSSSCESKHLALWWITMVFFASHWCWWNWLQLDRSTNSNSGKPIVISWFLVIDLIRFLWSTITILLVVWCVIYVTYVINHTNIVGCWFTWSTILVIPMSLAIPW